jgi:hypothetical protein
MNNNKREESDNSDDDSSQVLAGIYNVLGRMFLGLNLWQQKMSSRCQSSRAAGQSFPKRCGFVEHIGRALKSGGRAAVVPDLGGR